jgi:ribosomal protein S18 acetylase RimI-like enzyme
MPPHFQLATPGDAELLLDFMREYYAFDGHGYDREKARPALQRLLNDSALGLAWIVMDGDTPAGYIVVCFGYSLEYLGRDAFIDELYLGAAYRGRGWGRATLQYVEQQLLSHQVRAIHLEVVRENQAALGVYRKLGFRDHSHYLMSKWIEREFPKPASRTATVVAVDAAASQK